MPQQSPHARTGDNITTVNLPVSGFGVSVAVDCEGNVYYTLAESTYLYKMDKDGNLLSTTEIVDAIDTFAPPFEIL